MKKPLATLLASFLLTGCTSDTTAVGSCQPLLNEPEFKGHLLVEQEPAGSGVDRMLCTFVNADHRSSPAGTRVPSRQVTYDVKADSFTERTGTQEAQPSWADAPEGR